MGRGLPKPLRHTFQANPSRLVGWTRSALSDCDWKGSASDRDDVVQVLRILIRGRRRAYSTVSFKNSQALGIVRCIERPGARLDLGGNFLVAPGGRGSPRDHAKRGSFTGPKAREELCDQGGERSIVDAELGRAGRNAAVLGRRRHVLATGGTRVDRRRADVGTGDRFAVEGARPARTRGMWKERPVPPS